MPPQVIHPGEHLAEQLEVLKMSAAELARQLKVPTNRITPSASQIASASIDTRYIRSPIKSADDSSYATSRLVSRVACVVSSTSTHVSPSRSNRRVKAASAAAAQCRPSASGHCWGTRRKFANEYPSWRSRSTAAA